MPRLNHAIASPLAAAILRYLKATLKLPTFRSFKYIPHAVRYAVLLVSTLLSSNIMDPFLSESYIDDIFVKANILPERDWELDAIQYVIDQINPSKVVRPPEEVHIEGGDVMLWNDYIFIGTYKGSDYKDYITARTNWQGVDFIRQLFPNKIVKDFDLVKSKLEARDNALHLDCCFQPVGNDKGIIYKNGFREEADYLFLVNLFGKENLFHITRDEMYDMNSNVFSIAPNVVVSEKNFTRLNNWLREQGFVVEEIPYAEIAKQEGLLRCSTLPLLRD